MYSFVLQWEDVRLGCFVCAKLQNGMAYLMRV